MTTYQMLREYKCDKCDGSGWISVPKGDTTVARRCGCLAVKQSVWNIEHSGLADQIDEQTFAAFQTKQQWQEVIKSGAQQYAKSILNGGKEWMMICGQVGSGKTHLATAVMGELMLRGKRALYVTWRDVARELKTHQFDEDDFDAAMSRLIKPDILYIDDFFKGGKVLADGSIQITDGDKNFAYDIINGRYIRDKATIITCEKTCAEIMAIDEAIGSRIYQKTKTFYLEISKDAKKNVRFAV